ncbi:MAG: isocitrate/isopropylmalate family dehydrogenase, partial [Gemmataceae bacterium]|nr:isocitrate/isopropylmalate family dehydrogenase [Gemmataceae bacterium]
SRGLGDVYKRQIISDLTSALVGGLGFAPSANLGTEVAIFEAVHGSAPKYAGKNVINPTAVVLSAVMMLRPLGKLDVAALIENAILATLEDGKVMTGDVVGYDRGASTTAYTDAVIANLGRKPSRGEARAYQALKMPGEPSAPKTPASRRVVGADVFIESADGPEAVGPRLERAVENSPFRLKMISNRGTKVYPVGTAMVDCVDHYRCRFLVRDANASANDSELLDLLQRVAQAHRWVHVEKLQEFDGQPAYTLAQGED